MAKLLFALVDGFEDTEGIATIDVLTRGGHDVTLVNALDKEIVNSKLNIEMLIKNHISNANPNDYDGLIIPGGPGSFKVLNNLKIIDNLIEYFIKSKKLVAAICAAPHLIGRLGFLKDKNYTVHPGFEGFVIGGNYLRDNGVVVDQNIITAKSMYYSIDFGLAIHEYFTNKESKMILEKSLMGEK